MPIRYANLHLNDIRTRSLSPLQAISLPPASFVFLTAALLAVFRPAHGITPGARSWQAGATYLPAVVLSPKIAGPFRPATKAVVLPLPRRVSPGTARRGKHRIALYAA